MPDVGNTLSLTVTEPLVILEGFYTGRYLQDLYKCQDGYSYDDYRNATENCIHILFEKTDT